jgi:anti-repressor protein
MNELIKITYNNDRPAVSARDLHDFLEVKTAYKDWFPRMCEYGFTEGEDFNPLKIERVQNEGERIVARTVDDAVLTIDMAKELCMIQRNEKGKQARQYFLQIEKDWNSPEKVMARALQIAGDKLKRLESKVEADAPKVLFADAVSASKTSILVGELAKLLKQNGVDIGQHRLFRWMRENGYLIRRNGTDFNMPTQKSMDLGLFTVKETAITHSDGTVTVSKTTKVTGKGQQYFIQKFLGEEGTRK